jgi:CP family cyanate transporter-like MFS transporter
LIISSRVLLMLALVLAAINLRPGITSLAPLIERIATDLELSRGLISLVTALPVLCMGLLAPLAPRLATGLGLERAIALCMGLVALALVTRLLPGNAWLLIGSAGMLGAGIALAGPLLSGFIKRHFITGMGWVLAWYSLSMAVGGAAGVVFSAPLAEVSTLGWRFALGFWALPAALAVLLWCCLPNRVEAQGAAGGGLPWRVPRAWLVSSFFATQAGMFYTMATWGVARYTEGGLSLAHANSLFSLSMLAGIPCSFFLPWLAQRLDCRFALLVISGLITSVAVSLITFLPTLVPELPAVMMGVGLGGAFSLSLVLPMYEVRSPIEVSRWTAMMLCSGYCMACLMPVLGGLVRDLAGHYQAPYIGLMVLALLMTVLAWLLGRSQPSR